MKILAVLNPKSGVKSSKKQFIDALNIFSKHQNSVEVYITQKQNDAYEYLTNRKVNYDVVCGFGGDGTINEIVNALMKKKKKPLIGYFPSGTMNDFGSNFNLDCAWSEIAERICQGNYKEFDVGNYNGRYFNYVAAFGAFCDVPFSTDRSVKEAFGSMAYVFEAISKIPDIKPIDITVTCKGKKESYKALFGLVFSGNRVAGIELLDKKKGKINDGKFNVLIVEYVKSLLVDAPNILETLARQDKFFHWYSSNEIEIEFRDKTVWTLDGEEAKFTNHVKITNENKALKMLI